ncbi:MAG: 30S ribosomal protein S3ae [Candidatus Micrarchaeia archaeon]|jgi:small subunit ribosomal protein S3Ae
MAGKKLVDNWKMKRWYSIVAPKFFNEVEVAQVPALDDEHIINRIIEIPLKEITHDLSHMYTNVRLRVFEVKGKTAYTKFIGHSVSREFLRTMVRRHRDALTAIVPVTSKDGIEFRVKAMAITNSNCSGSQKTALRNLLADEVKKRARGTEFGAFINDTIYGKVALEIGRKLVKIVPVRKVEIYKTQLKEEFDVEEKQELPEDAKREAGSEENAA